jgi:hypothetical protein
MNDLDVRRDLDALQRLKAHYCRFLDTRDWTAWRAFSRTMASRLTTRAIDRTAPYQPMQPARSGHPERV